MNNIVRKLEKKGKLKNPTQVFFKYVYSRVKTTIEKTLILLIKIHY